MSDQETNSQHELPQSQQGVVIPLEVRCKNCYHFKKQKAKNYADVCANLGVLELGRPCKYFMVNVSSMSLKTEQGELFSNILDKIPSSQLKAYAALINQETSTRKQGFRHGQTVYVRIYPGEYLSNYAKAKVLLAAKNTVVLQGVDTDFRGSFLKTSVLNEEAFNAKKKALIVRKRINDPEFSTYLKWKPKIVIKELKEYVPPSIDSMPKETVRRKKDLADIIIRGSKK